MLPRGIRLNNPGNIRRTQTIWQGQSECQDDSEFIRFNAPESGMRALMLILLAYQRRYNLKTVQSMISRWAPPQENDTQSYVLSVSKHMHVLPTQEISLENVDLIISMAEAITRHENGACSDPTFPYWYDAAVFRAAADLALNLQEPPHESHAKIS